MKHIIYYLIQMAMLLAVIGYMIAAQGCASPKPAISDSTTNTLIDRETVDSLIGVAADTARAHLTLVCDSLGDIYISEINTLNGERTRLQIALRAAQDALNTKSSTDTQRNAQTAAKPKVVYIDVDCNSDSLQLLVNKLRERITLMESHKEKETIVEKVIPDYYRNCTKGFWVLLVIAITIVAFWILDKIPATKPYTTIIKTFMHLL